MGTLECRAKELRSKKPCFKLSKGDTGIKTTFIYALKEPLTGEIRYIGKADDPRRRLIIHRSRSAKYDSHLGRWIRSLGIIRSSPVLEVLDEVPGTQWQFWEREYIRVFRAIGMDLVNTTDGGDGLKNPSQETKNKIRDSLNRSAPWKTRVCSEETRRRLSKANSGSNHPRFGKTASQETRAKMSAAHSGVNNPFFGKKMTEAHRAALSAAHSNGKSFHIGRTRSEETKAKMRAAWAIRKTKVS